MSNWKDVLNKAKEKTNEELINEIKSFTFLSEDEITAIAPTAIDKTKLAEVLSTIQDVTKSNEDKNKIIKEIADTSDMILGLINKIFKS